MAPTASTTSETTPVADGADRDGDDDYELTDSMHVRAGLMTDIPGLRGAASLTPADDREGMLHRQDSAEREARYGRELAHSVVRIARKLREAAGKGEAKLDDDGTRKSHATTTRPSVAFRRGEVETVAKVLEEVDKTAAKRMREGFNEKNFAAGVLNSFFVAYAFGKWPEHFWILYLVETAVLVPVKFLHMVRAKPLNEALYYLDLCWMLNFVGMVALACFALVDRFDLPDPTTPEIRKHVYLAAAGAACGPLLGATALLPFVAFLFHDVRTMTGLFIHILPPMVAYTFMWHGDEIHDAWPRVFKLNYLDDVRFFPEGGPLFLPFTGLGTVAGNAIALYFCWFVPYVIWMVAVGMDLPRSERRRLGRDGRPLPPVYDTVFHCTVRGGLAIMLGQVCWKRQKALSVKQMEANDFELRDFLVYMLFHAVMAVLSVYVLAYPCFVSKAVHLCLLTVLTVICVYRGSKRYTYYSTSMYGRLIRKNFENLMAMEMEETSKTK